ncbi:MAG: ABC transporter ATP-binding protein [Bacteroidetes bacterium]|nr:ABC transporter ATP-binding protein [Bacteroidota bacterium]MCL5025903.1 ABC transporter ATP-binding protein [Chloroflexota bacterium]
MDDLAIVADNLSKRFGTTVAVDGLSLEVKRGQAYGLVGPDGAGKTTAIRLLAGLLLPASGSVQVLGTDVVRYPERIKERIGYMPQRFALYGDLTVDENLTFFARLYQVPREEWASRADRLLSFSGLHPFRHRLADNLSGGMKQKLALACTLIHRPELILLDEPTTGVDPVSRREFWQILYGLLQDGITVLVSTPYMDEAERCNMVGFIIRGRIRLAGTPAELKSGLPYRLLELRSPAISTARRVVATVPGVLDVQPFGDALHLAVSDPASAVPIVQAALEHDGVAVHSLREVAPSMEDVFFQMVRSR